MGSRPRYKITETPEGVEIVIFPWPYTWVIILLILASGFDKLLSGAKAFIDDVLVGHHWNMHSFFLGMITLCLIMAVVFGISALFSKTYVSISRNGIVVRRPLLKEKRIFADQVGRLSINEISFDAELSKAGILLVNLVNRLEKATTFRLSCAIDNNLLTLRASKADMDALRERISARFPEMVSGS